MASAGKPGGVTSFMETSKRKQRSLFKNGVARCISCLSETLEIVMNLEAWRLRAALKSIDEGVNQWSIHIENIAKITNLQKVF